MVQSLSSEAIRREEICTSGLDLVNEWANPPKGSDDNPNAPTLNSESYLQPHHGRRDFLTSIVSLVMAAEPLDTHVSDHLSQVGLTSTWIEFA